MAEKREQRQENEDEGPFYNRVKKLRQSGGGGEAAGSGGSPDTSNLFGEYRRQFKFGKFTLSASSSFRGLEYWASLRLKDANQEKLWPMNFQQAKVGFTYGERTAAEKNRFYATAFDFDILLTHLFPCEDYVDFLLEIGQSVVTNFKKVNEVIDENCLPQMITDTCVIAETRSEDGTTVHKLCQKIDCFWFVRNWEYLNNTNGKPPRIDSIKTSDLTLSLKYVRCTESGETAVESSSIATSMSFQCPFLEFVQLYQYPKFATFCTKLQEEMPAHAYNKDKVDKIKGRKKKEKTADEEVEIDSLPATQSLSP